MAENKKTEKTNKEYYENFAEKTANDLMAIEYKIANLTEKFKSDLTAAVETKTNLEILHNHATETLRMINRWN